jgi:hypothetical protein
LCSQCVYSVLSQLFSFIEVYQSSAEGHFIFELIFTEA